MSIKPDSSKLLIQFKDGKFAFKTIKTTVLIFVRYRLEQARKWLSNPGQDDKGLGRRAINAIVEEGRKVILLKPPNNNI